MRSGRSGTPRERVCTGERVDRRIVGLGGCGYGRPLRGGVCVALVEVCGPLRGVFSVGGIVWTRESEFGADVPPGTVWTRCGVFCLSVC